ncbi:hypothetical protein ACFSKL_14495 [Belliella marina]|uniref:Uncharacterized protein n=1 Tax=Belliella marina TaxID=1644146 RepID=A0ABW4VQS8_9BACT
MKNRFTSISSLIIAISIFACNSMDEIDEPVKSYELADMKWKHIEQDEDNLVEFELPQQTFRNEGDNPIPIEINPLEGIMGTSKFEFDQPEFFLEMNLGEHYLMAPRYHGNQEGYFYVGGGQEVLLDTTIYEFPLSIETTESYTLTPNTELIYEGTVHLKEIKVKFLARVIEKVSGASYDLEGTWTSSYYETMSINVVANDIE